MVRINRSVVEVGGYSEKEIVGRRFKFLNMFPPLSIAKMLTNFSKLIAGQATPRFEAEAYTKDGNRLDVEMRGSLLIKKGVVAGIIGVIRDITERKRTENALRVSEEEYRAIFNGVGEGIAVLDKTSKIVKVNQRILEVSGYDEGEIYFTGRNTI